MGKMKCLWPLQRGPPAGLSGQIPRGNMNRYRRLT